MRHRVGGYKLGRNTPHRIAMWRNMATSLFTYGQITTTLKKAKSVQPFAERLITLARRGDLAARRRIIAQLGDPIMIKSEDDPDVKRNKYGELVGGPRLVRKLVEEIGPGFADRAGGYTRIVRLGSHRIGDGGDLCVLQLVGGEDGPQVSGSFSRRRQKADKRMQFAAKLRRGGDGDGGGEQATAVAEPEGPQEEAAGATEADEQEAGPEAEASSSEEGPDEKKTAGE